MNKYNKRRKTQNINTHHGCKSVSEPDQSVGLDGMWRCVVPSVEWIIGMITHSSIGDEGELTRSVEIHWLSSSVEQS